jgi:hypothetical protein
MDPGRAGIGRPFARADCYAPRAPVPRTSPIARCAFVLAMGIVPPACGDEPSGSGNAPATASRPMAPAGLAQGDVAALLEALRQPHARARAATGPHRMVVHATFDLSPQGEPATPEPAVDELRPSAQHVDDNLELLWVTSSPNQPRFSLSQSNDHDRGRDVVVDGEAIYTRQRNRGWYVGPLQSDLYELWLDDAQRSVYDAVALAAPQLAVAVAAGDAGRLSFTLSRAATTNAALVVADERATWRKAAAIDEIAGTLEVDGHSGAWLKADVRVGFSMPGPDGRRLAGRVTLVAQTTAVDAQTPLAVPTGALPLLERDRYDAERARVLDGLAGR